LTKRGVVLDANILVRGVLGVRVPGLFSQHQPRIAFLAPPLAFEESAKHLGNIAQKRGDKPARFQNYLADLREFVTQLSPETISPFRGEALARIGGRDPDDWPVVAAALASDCPIWTEDHDFFGCGIPTWTTATIEIYLTSK
jgi:predicted nucleic acid-binding protein